MLRRHPLLSLLALLLLLTTVALGIFLYRFDLDHYRSDLEQTLSTTLGKPVRLGHAHFAFSHGLSLQFDEVRVGTDADSGMLAAEQLALRLELTPLFWRRLNFDRLYLDRPVLQLSLHSAPPGETADWQRSLQLVQDVARITRVRSLVIHQGSIIVSDRRQQPPRQWSLDQLDLRVSNLTLQEPIDLSAAARLAFDGNHAPLTLTGTLTLPERATDWRETALNLKLSLKHCAPGPWLAAWFGPQAPVSAAGDFDLLLELAGIPSRGLQLQADLRGRDFSLLFPAWYQAPWPVGRLHLVGTWTTGNGQRLSEMHCDWDGLRLSGSLTWPEENERPGVPQAELQLAELPLLRLLPLIPTRSAPQLAEQLRQRLRGGTLRDVHLLLHWPETAGTDPLQVLQQGEFSLRDGAFELPRLGNTGEVSLRGRWLNGHLRIENGRATLAAGTLEFSGETRFTAAAPPQIKMQARGLLDAAGAIHLLPLPDESRRIAVGKAPVEFTASGTPERLSVNLQANLSDLGLSLFGETIKAAGDPGDLFAVAEVHAGIVDLGHARLTIPAGEMLANGRAFLAPPHAYRLGLDLSKLDLKQLTRHDELGRLLQVQGEMALHLDLAGDDQGLKQREGWIDVRNLGLHFAGVVADLTRAGGRIRLEQDRAVIESARGYLGSSVLTGTGTLELQKAFRLVLDIHGESLLAADLVFPSDRQRLSGLAGRLVIDGNGILFEQISTRLGTGTRAVVNGQLLGYTHPHLELDIAAEQADIAEILTLWQAPATPHAGKHSEPGGKGHLTVRIESRVARGNLFGLPFSDGRGIITLRDGMLLVHPVQFKTGTGFCRGQAVLRELTAATPLLTITGHVENADASAVYNQMLGRRGLVSGNLSGDFAIQGRLGATFLPTSMGGFSLQVEQGELRRFPVLSKIFSVLNVSQIFALRLPDLAAEGMPFRLLQGTFSLLNGTLRTEDLVVRSDAMNLALIGDFDLRHDRLDVVLGIKPLATVDKVVSSIPLAGWVLTGQDKTLITAQFHVRGGSEDPKVDAIPITSVSDTVVGIFKRLFGLPAKVIGDVRDLVEGDGKGR